MAFGQSHHAAPTVATGRESGEANGTGTRLGVAGGKRGRKRRRCRKDKKRARHVNVSGEHKNKKNNQQLLQRSARVSFVRGAAVLLPLCYQLRDWQADTIAFPGSGAGTGIGARYLHWEWGGRGYPVISLLSSEGRKNRRTIGVSLSLSLFFFWSWAGRRVFSRKGAGGGVRF